jgi:hypothetical protein
MTGLEIVALVGVAIWLLVLTVALLLTIRQIALINVRLEQGQETFEVGNDGLDIGSVVPSELLVTVPQLRAELTYVLLISATCRICQELASNLGGVDIPGQVVALVPGPDRLAERVTGALPPAFDVVRDPLAADVAKRLEITSTPFALQLDRGVVTGKTYLSSVDDLRGLLDAREGSDALEIAEMAKEVAQVGER